MCGVLLYMFLEIGTKLGPFRRKVGVEGNHSTKKKSGHQ